MHTIPDPTLNASSKAPDLSSATSPVEHVENPLDVSQVLLLPSPGDPAPAGPQQSAFSPGDNPNPSSDPVGRFADDFPGAEASPISLKEDVPLVHQGANVLNSGSDQDLSQIQDPFQ